MDQKMEHKIISCNSQYCSRNELQRQQY